MASCRDVLNILIFVRLQVALMVFSYLSYCLGKDWEWFKKEALDITLHAIVGLAAHLCMMTCGISVLHADSFCARKITTSARTTLHGYVMMVAATNSMFSFWILQFISDYIDKKTLDVTIQHSMGNFHTTCAIITITMEVISVFTGYFLYKTRNIMDCTKSQKVYIMIIHNLFGYLAYAGGTMTMFTGLTTDFDKKDTETKYYTASLILICIICILTLAHFACKWSKLINFFGK